MAAEWLRADQVAAIGQRAREAARDCTKPGGWKDAAVYVAEQDIPALVAQDGRWRALVGELLAALGAIEGYTDASEVDYAIEAFVNGYDECADARPTTQRIYAAIAQAQAALDGAPGGGVMGNPDEPPRCTWRTAGSVLAAMALADSFRRGNPIEIPALGIVLRYRHPGHGCAVTLKSARRRKAPPTRGPAAE